jgi:DNA-binding beta-propeller fold protein YncE
MKKILFFFSLYFLTTQILVATGYASQPAGVDWTEIVTWKLDARPLDMVHTLDNQKVYILGSDSKVYIFSANGEKLGFIPVDKGVTSIDIEPRGARLYLVNEKDNTFTSLAVSFVTPIDITGSPFLGNEKAPVVLAVFSDFQ